MQNFFQIRFTKVEWKLIGLVSCVVILFACIPSLYGIWLASTHGMVWFGRPYFSNGDYPYYLSLIEQAKQGRWLLDNLFTTEPTMPFFHFFWLFIGFGARFFHISSIAAYHISRICLIPVLCVMTYGFVSLFFSSIRLRILTTVLFLFGSGIGGILPIWWECFYMFQPIDRWMPESTPFLSILYSPHFVASTILLLMCFFLLIRLFQTRTWKTAIMTGVVVGIFYQLHPYYLILFTFIPLIFLFLEWIRGHFDDRSWMVFLMATFFSLPTIGYYYFLNTSTPETKMILGQSITLSPSGLYILLGFGLFIPLAGIGLWIKRKEITENIFWRFLAVWLIVQPLLLYIPVDFQRRLIEGWLFPPVVFSVVAVQWIWEKMRYKIGYNFFLVFLVLFLSSSSIVLWVINIHANNPVQTGENYLTQDTVRAFEWMRTNFPENAVVITVPSQIDELGGWIGRRVYAGHWANTIENGRKYDALTKFFDPTTTETWRKDFLQTHGVIYVYTNAHFKWNESPPSYVNLIYQEGSSVVYRIF
jgi:hypothetical protein